MTNIVAFGVFVDVGVHRDGLVNVSQLADRYAADPNQVVRVGRKVRVTVLTVDLARKRIALSMRSTPEGVAGKNPGSGTTRPSGEPPARGEGRRPAPPAAPTRTYGPGEVAPNGVRFR